MFGIINYFGFVASSVMLNITPGSDTIYILSRSAVGGKKEGIVSALGICTGILIHTILAAFGLSAILAGSKTAFNIMKLLGAAYLAAMGIVTLFSKKTIISSSDTEKKPLMKIFRQGVLTNALNPKVALFFLALLPQFVSPDNTYGPIPFLILGLTFFSTSSVWCTIVAFVASFVSRLLNKNQKISVVATKITGIIYILLGLNVLRG
jgi:threonine/homoserine/homoserine lactone efflux protein